MNKVFVLLVVFGVSSVYAQNILEVRQAELERYKSNFYDTFHNVCMNGFLQHIPKDNNALITKAKATCDCYTSTMIAKIDWVQWEKLVTNEEKRAYWEKLHPEIASICQARLAKQSVQQPVQPSYATINKHETKRVRVRHWGFMTGVINGILAMLILWIIKKVISVIKNTKK